MNSDCRLTQLVCFDQRVCIDNQAPKTAVALRLSPPVASGKLTEHFELDVAASNQTEVATLMLAEPAVVHGQVRRDDNPTYPVPGTLVATAPTEATGTTLQFQATVYNSAKYCPSGQACQDFELRVQSGYTYALAFYPQEQSVFPPHYSSLTAGGSVDGWKIALPVAFDLVKVTGRLMAGDQPLGGMRVFLEGAEGRPTSTRDETSAQPRKIAGSGAAEELPPGTFRLWVDPTAQPGRLRFEPVEASDTLPRGRVGAMIDAAAAGLKKSAIDLGVLNLGPVPTATKRVITVLGATGEPEAGALVRLQRVVSAPSLDDLDAIVEASGLTDKLGQFEATLPAGKVMAFVQPGPSSASGRWVGPLVITSEPAQVTCPPRVSLGGRVLDYAGQPVSKAIVFLRKVGGLPGEVLAHGSGGQSDPSAQAVTDKDGNFSSPIDPGSWWLWVIPAEGALLPRFLASRVDVLAGEVPAPLVVSIPPPMLVRGKVVTASGAPVANVGVDVLGLANLAPNLLGPSRHPAGGDGDDPPGTTVVAQSHLLATTVTNASGYFEVLIAPAQ